jgi:hypothetical protein
MTKQNNGPAPDGYGDRTSPFRPAARKPVLHRVVPVSQDLPGYRGGTLRRDLLAGITVAALALPSAMAYAELAGLSPVAGLYALLLPTVAYTLLGSCRQLIVGPEGSVAALVATALIPSPPATRSGTRPWPRCWPCWSAASSWPPGWSGWDGSPTTSPVPC